MKGIAMSVSPPPVRRNPFPGITSGLSDLILAAPAYTPPAFAQMAEQNRQLAKLAFNSPAYTPPAFAQMAEQNRQLAKLAFNSPAYTPPAFAQMAEQSRQLAKLAFNSPAFTQMTEQVRLSLARSPAFVRLVEQSQPAFRNSTFAPVELAVGGEVLTLPPVPELLNSMCEAGESRDFNEFADLLEADPEWDAALDRAVEQVRMPLFARPAVKKAIVWGVLLSVAGVLCVTMGNFDYVGLVLAALGWSAQGPKVWVEGKLDKKWPTPERDDVPA